MRKPTGSTIVDCFDHYGAKVKSEEKSGYITAMGLVDEWEAEHKFNTAVVSKILYNTVDKKRDKWGHDDERD